jgi:tRNA threonylcarbamoyladenosine biosynthesis protein TsaB
MTGAQEAPSINPADQPPPPRLLALDTSTHRTEVALGLGAAVQTSQTGEGGAQASAQLLPTIQAMLAQQRWTLAELDALVFGRGPGAFTGLRTATAVVQGLAYGVRTERHPDGLPVLPIDTLLAVAEDARHRQPAHPAATPLWVLSVLDARMGEVYAAVYRFDDPHQPVAHHVAGPWLAAPHQLPQLLASLPDLQAATHRVCAGNASELIPPALSDPAHGTPWPLQAAWPTAHALLRLAPHLLAQGMAVNAALAQPLYVRDKVAQTTAERSEARAT